MRKINDLEKEVMHLVEKAGLDDEEEEEEEAGAGTDGRTPGDLERQVKTHRDDDGGSDDDDDDDEGSDGMSVGSTEERFKELGDEVAVLIADIHDLSLFTKLNFTGFVKIVKKHDVSDRSLCSFSSSPTRLLQYWDNTQC